MNYRLVSKNLGHLAFAVALLILPCAPWAVYYGEWRSLAALLASSVCACGIGGLLLAGGRHAPAQFFQREALALVGLGWVLVALIGALPFWIGGVLDPVDALFESTAGFTTAGSSVLQDIEATDKSILFWRSYTHWIGGMGIVVLFIAVLPYLGVGGKQLFKSESSGPDPRGLTPRIKDTAWILFKIYLLMTVAQTLALMMAGVSLFDALCHTFGTLATGGFSPRQASVGAYDSLAVELIIVVFMVAGATNFGLYHSMSEGDWLAPLKNTEWRVFICILAGATLLITANLLGMQGHAPMGPEPPTPDYNAGEALRAALFQVASILTTTGFATEDFDAWPHMSRYVFFVLMLIGGCAGSTSGGVKVVRLVILAKMAYWRMEGAFRPKTVRPIRINGLVLDQSILNGVVGFFLLYVGVFFVASFLMAAVGLPFTTALSSVAATLNTVGPGLEFVGAARDFSQVPDLGKLVLCFCMMMARLELLTVLVLFMPSFWKHA